MGHDTSGRDQSILMGGSSVRHVYYRADLRARDVMTDRPTALSLSLSLFFLMGGSRIFACCDCPCTPESGRIAFAGPDIHLWRQKAFQYYYISVPMEILCRGLPPKFSFRLIIGSTPFCFLFGF